ncbi:MAG: ankyrin repeat domain-containing protein, partial [Candidatus Adiutrix sp.]|nr:ankyrin repeat domain-containing protein [Candidatus Adiutrix sp.]
MLRPALILLLSILSLTVPISAAETPLQDRSQSGGLADLFRKGSTQAVTQALAGGANLNLTDQDGQTPLMLAAGSNPEPQVTELLLSKGADPSAREKKFGLTPLMFATMFNKPAVAQTLLRGGADPDQRNDHGGTALHQAAATTPLPGMVLTLAAAGADLNAV